MALRDLLDKTTGPLNGVLALDFGQAAVSPIAASYLGMLGATVIKVEQPSGDLVRWVTPTIGDTGTTFIGNNITKLGVVVDLKNPGGLARAKSLIADADVLIENFRSPAIMQRLGLGYEVMRQINRRIIYVQASAFGRDGPWVGMFSHEWIAQTVSGFVSVTGDASGVPEWSRGTANLDWNGAMVNVAAMLTGLIRREQTGRGMMIETAQLGSSIFAGITRYAELFATGSVPKPMGSARPNIVPDQSFKTADGYINVCVPSEKFWPPLCETLGERALTEERFGSNQLRIAHRDELIALLDKIFAKRTSAEWLGRLRTGGVPCGAHVRDRMSSDVLLDDEQVKANGMMQRVETPWGEIRSQAPHWKFEKTPASITRGSPRLGQDTERVFAAVEANGVSPAPKQASASRAKDTAKADAAGALRGLRVLEIAEGIPGPTCGMMLARLGAEVTKIEPPDGDWLRAIPPLVEGQSALFRQLNAGKRSARLNLKSPEGREAIARLACGYDVVIACYRPQKLECLGISYAQLATNRTLIYCQISGWGTKGPRADLPATEYAVQVAAGLTRHLGYKDGAPIRQGFDIVSVATGIATLQGILASLYWRTYSGEGQKVEVSMLGTAIAINQWDIVAESETVSRDVPSPGIQLESYDWPPDLGFECADGSCLIDFLGHEEGWSLFFAGLGREDLLGDPRFNTINDVRNHKRLLPGLLNPTLKMWSLEHLEALVREHQGTILPALNLAQVVDHEQIRRLELIVREGAASEPMMRPPFRSAEPLQVDGLRAAPRLGEHTAEVLREKQ
jgi:crotonobetainyl-CoA:carnitine CoA-transferase CaiB-like acyl-CoA transferase